MPELTASEWDSLITQYPDAHLLQTTAWGELKSTFGWYAVRICTNQGGISGAQVLFRKLPAGYSWAYLPKGPIGENWDALWPEIDIICRKRRSIFLKVEPDLWSNIKVEDKQPPAGFLISSHAIQPPRTSVVDITGSEDSVLGRMKQKTRYNIKLALKKGVVVHPSADLETFYQLVRITSERDQFGVHNLEYYRRAYLLYYERGACELLMAEYQHEPLAALMVFVQGRRAWYLYGASANESRERMPTYSLQWEAMRWARSRGCAEYDLWGVPDEDESTLEANFTQRSDGLWGVYRFKRGFGGQIRRAVSPWDRVYIPALYRAYLLWLKVGREEG